MLFAQPFDAKGFKLKRQLFKFLMVSIDSGTYVTGRLQFSGRRSASSVAYWDAIGCAESDTDGNIEEGAGSWLGVRSNLLAGVKVRADTVVAAQSKTSVCLPRSLLAWVSACVIEEIQQ